MFSTLVFRPRSRLAPKRRGTTGRATLAAFLCCLLTGCSVVKTLATGYRTYKDDFGAFSVDVPVDWQMRRVIYPASQYMPSMRVIYITPKEAAGLVLPKVTEPQGLDGIAEPVVVIGVADETIQGISDIPIADAFGGSNLTTVSETTRLFGGVTGKETELRWPDASGTKYGQTIVLTEPGLTLFLIAVVGESKKAAYGDTINHMLDSLKPKAG